MMHATQFQRVVQSLRLQLANESDTERLGKKLATLLPFAPSVWLHGELGAGKSTLARACLRQLGVTGAIKSPTYTLVERYPLAVGEAWHLDLYRIAMPDELDFLGLDEADVRFWLIEWAEKGAKLLPAPALEVLLSHNGTGGRNAEISTAIPEIEALITKWKEEFH